ncbi:MAG: ubiquinol-cytochrome c reductase iron-sulfur subunit [Planctomycetes bacterium]|nr:ubiquinol-cytochrome c reductase iron-sulfur subunit [Planctomycetota bacterium]MCH9723333.1 ubiquinol-cytochrome c reductase iron-sulfur subunit [Planctomycetota bacterium]MCH9779092.1 ubiquinol-cytochrome c reductase iron-sulfur subunit [Planctomycetota bacterium]MCH9789705.1 ubiquinol-cytochrome c reductase iron-sulfur subunit [Planctomycetota bacterium]MDF1742250.1 ubiquinol-cytochrome c reductase iron-sulfur subunit [Gimesia sp.]
MNNQNDQSEKPCCQQPRRTFLTRLSIGLSAVIGFVITLPAIGFVLAPVFKKPKAKWRSVGKLEDFKVDGFVLVQYEDPSPVAWAGVTAKAGAWIRRASETEFIAFSINCRHLGCPVRWVDDPKLFMCPCHGGVYYEDGTVAAGPPPEPLERLSVRINKGMVEIQTIPTPLTLTTLT